MNASLLKKCMGLGEAVVESVRGEGGSIVVCARPRKAAPRCPECGRRCAAYDTLPARRWRAPDLGSSRCYVERAPVRVECPEHGVRSAPVPWARGASSRFTSAFEDEVAWPALHMCRSALEGLRRAGGALWRGCMLKEGLRAVFKEPAAEAAGGLDAWLGRARRSRIPQFVELSRKVRRKREGIPRPIGPGVSNARVEAVNNKIKVAIRQGHGFRNVDNLIALVMLRCSDLKPALPGR